MSHITDFDKGSYHINLVIYVTTTGGKRHKLEAILDTGAPRSEFSDQALESAGFHISKEKSKSIKPGLQTQKYDKITLPAAEICSHRIKDFEVFVSHFDKSWGVDALIGLDFFRQFEVTINYTHGQITTTPLDA